jgi:hypothetical protein
MRSVPDGDHYPARCPSAGTCAPFDQSSWPPSIRGPQRVRPTVGCPTLRQHHFRPMILCLRNVSSGEQIRCVTMILLIVTVPMVHNDTAAPMDRNDTAAAIATAKGHTVDLSSCYGNRPGSAAAECSNQVSLRLTLIDRIHRSDLPQRPSSTSVHLVCIKRADHCGPDVDHKSSRRQFSAVSALQTDRLRSRSSANSGQAWTLRLQGDASRTSRISVRGRNCK